MQAGASQQQKSRPGVGLEARLELRLGHGWGRATLTKLWKVFMELYILSMAQVIEFYSTEHVRNVWQILTGQAFAEAINIL